MLSISNGKFGHANYQPGHLAFGNEWSIDSWEPIADSRWSRIWFYETS